MSDQPESEHDRPYDDAFPLRGAIVDDRHVIHAEWDEETQTLRVWYDRPL